MATAFGAANVSAEPSEVWADGRDRYTLLTQHLVNRQLFVQLDDEDQAFRLGRSWDRVRVAADFSTGLQGTPTGDSKSRFHGFYLANGYAAVRLLDGLEANLNVLLFNPSASDGYRRSTELGAGLALHGFGTLGKIENDPVRVDVVATDLDQVTLGTGLLLEQVRLEGLRGGISWRDWAFDALVGGRAFWDDDDIYAATLSGFGKMAEIRLVGWDRQAPTQTDPFQNQPTEDISGPIRTAWYVGGSVDVPVLEDFRVAAEYEAHFREPIRSAFLARGDYLNRDLGVFQVHAGYQFRWYEAGFGPRHALISPTTTYAVPYQEDMYVTNSFEYFGISEFFEQWSHSVMLEGRARIEPHLELFVESELWLRYARNRSERELVVYTPSGFRAPGRELAPYYRAGACLYPWPAYPHRASLFLTNKQVESGVDSLGFLPSADDNSTRRYDPGTYLLLTLEAYL